MVNFLFEKNISIQTLVNIEFVSCNNITQTSNNTSKKKEHVQWMSFFDDNIKPLEKLLF